MEEERVYAFFVLVNTYLGMAKIGDTAFIIVH